LFYFLFFKGPAKQPSSGKKTKSGKEKPIKTIPTRKKKGKGTPHSHPAAPGKSSRRFAGNRRSTKRPRKVGRLDNQEAKEANKSGSQAWRIKLPKTSTKLTVTSKKFRKAAPLLLQLLYDICNSGKCFQTLP
jgi:hypothetical protein